MRPGSTGYSRHATWIAVSAHGGDGLSRLAGVIGLPLQGQAQSAGLGEITAAVRSWARQRSPGEETAVMDSGEETTLCAGDVLIQNGTLHKWVNRGPGNCVIGFVLVGADRDAATPPSAH